MNFPFLKKEKVGLREQMTFVGNTCEIYIPTYFIIKDDDAAFATDLGDRIETIGLINFKADGKLYSITMPIKFQFQFTSVDKKNFSPVPGVSAIDYYIYTLKKGDAFVYDISHRKSADDMKYFISKVIESGKLPPYISYEDSLDIFLKAMIAADVGNLGIDGTIMEMMLSEYYRNKKNMSEPFRKAFNGHNNFDFKTVRITKIPQLTSTFTGLCGEDISTQIVSAVAKNREGIPEKETPIEKIIKY